MGKYEKNCLQEYNPGLQPSQTGSEKVRGGFIEAVNKVFDFGAGYNHLESGKWMKRFNKGDPAIDTAWKKTLEGIKEGDFYEAKVAPLNDQFPDQILIVYTENTNNIEDIVRVYDAMIARGIASSEDDLEYKTNRATTQQSDELIYNSNEIPGLRKQISASSNKSAMFANSTSTENTTLLHSETKQSGCCSLV